jgi:hypothetical protein
LWAVVVGILEGHHHGSWRPCAIRLEVP